MGKLIGSCLLALLSSAAQGQIYGGHTTPPPAAIAPMPMSPPPMPMAPSITVAPPPAVAAPLPQAHPSCVVKCRPAACTSGQTCPDICATECD